MVNGVYHKDVYFPRDLVIQLPSCIQNIQYTTHAIEQAKVSNIELPRAIYGNTVFEATICNNQIVKAGYRIPYTKNYDLCLILAFYPDRTVGITVWLNHYRNVHANIKRDNYVQGKR